MTQISSHSTSPTLLTRVAAVVIAALAGVLVGTVGTVSHRNVLAFDPVVIPIGLIISLIAVLCLLVGIRMVLERRATVLAAAVGLVATIALFTLPGAGGAVLITDSILSMVWLLGPVLLATLIVAWPQPVVRASHIELAEAPSYEA